MIELFSKKSDEEFNFSYKPEYFLLHMSKGFQFWVLSFHANVTLKVLSGNYEFCFDEKKLLFLINKLHLN